MPKRKRRLAGPISRDNYDYGVVSEDEEDFWEGEDCVLCDLVFVAGQGYVELNDKEVDARVKAIQKTFEKTGKLGAIPLTEVLG